MFSHIPLKVSWCPGFRRGVLLILVCSSGTIFERDVRRLSRRSGGFPIVHVAFWFLDKYGLFFRISVLLCRGTMNPWLETILVFLVAVSGVFLGRFFSRLPKRYWIAGSFLPFVLVAMLVIVRCNPAIGFTAPFSWISMGRMRFVFLSLAVTMGLTCSVSRLPYKSERILVCMFMTVVVVWFCVLPFLVPALIRADLSNIETKLDSNGICHQSKAYTCGPAAAVTALRRLGLQAHEGQIAVLSHTSPIVGTLPACLSAALENRYGAEGLECEYRGFDSISQLRDAGVTLAVVKDAFLLDHCVAVLEVSDQTVTVADPVFGKTSMTYEQFEKVWRFSGIVLRRDSAQKI